MLATDLKGLWDGLKNNTMFHLVVLLCVCAFLYSMLSGYMSRRNNFENVKILYGTADVGNGLTKNCRGIPRMDEAIIRNMIDLPNRNPAMLTSSMVIPEMTTPNMEDTRRTRMDILNMFYNTFDEDVISIKYRPKGLYVIP